MCAEGAMHTLNMLITTLTWSKFSNLSISMLVSRPICGGSCVNLGLPDRSSDCKVVIAQIHRGTSYKLFLAIYKIDNLAFAILLGNVSRQLSFKLSVFREVLHLQFLGSSTILFSESRRSRKLDISSKLAGIVLNWFLLKSKQQSLVKMVMLLGTLVSRFEAKKSFSTHVMFSSHEGSRSPRASLGQSIRFCTWLQFVFNRKIPTASFFFCWIAKPIGTAMLKVSLSEIHLLQKKDEKSQ